MRALFLPTANVIYFVQPTKYLSSFFIVNQPLDYHAQTPVQNRSCLSELFIGTFLCNFL